MADDARHGSRRQRLRVALGLIWAVLGVLCAPTLVLGGCDRDLLVGQARQTFPDYDVTAVRVDGGIVTLVLARPDGAAAFGIGLRTAGTAYFTSVMPAAADAMQSAERARVSQLVAAWYERKDIQQALERCDGGVTLDTDAAQEAVRQAATDALGGGPVGEVGESRLVIAALVVALALITWPRLRRPRGAMPREPVSRRDAAVVLGMAIAAIAVAAAVGWRLAPETDEVVTLGTRHEALASLLSWKVGGEPFNPPGTPLLFALWLRLASGFAWARVLSIVLIPVTAWLAYRGARSMGDRYVGLAFAGLVVLAPAYLRLAAVARGYSLTVLALCAMVAAVGRTRDGASRGESVGVACLLGLWVSYLLWPLVFAAPWVARLARRDRVRVTAALGLMGAALAPRLWNGFSAAMSKGDVYELRGPADALGYALAAVGQAPPADYAGSGDVAWLAGGMALALLAVAMVYRRGAIWQLRSAALLLVAALAPVLALLGGGHGIRERHVIALQVALALLAAMGLGRLLAAPRGSRARLLGWLLAIALAAVSVRGHAALVLRSEGWISGLDRMCAGADLLVIVPRSAQMSVHAMLSGNSPLGSEGTRWPPVCQSDSEWWCRRVGGMAIVSVDRPDDSVMTAAADAVRSVWVYANGAAPALPSRMRRCRRIWRDSMWSVFECAGSALRGSGPVP